MSYIPNEYVLKLDSQTTGNPIAVELYTTRDNEFLIDNSIDFSNRSIIISEFRQAKSIENTGFKLLPATPLLQIGLERVATPVVAIRTAGDPFILDEDLRHCIDKPIKLHLITINIVGGNNNG